mgnify:CR=1 FL=1|jgi:hypothetical protein|tara:strand:+ start:286 stop:672 length:387 start_codon:yes stop_codon:yes gene_type:complete
MATVTSKLTLSSTDLLSQTLNLSLTNAITVSHTTGLARAPITSTAIGTTSGQVTLYTADDFAAIAYMYVKNTDTTSANYIYVYTGSNIWLKIAGGEFAFLPMVADDTLKAYAATSGTVVEWMVFGTDQ